jgi:hypothetical protein
VSGDSSLLLCRFAGGRCTSSTSFHTLVLIGSIHNDYYKTKDDGRLQKQTKQTTTGGDGVPRTILV